MKLAIHETGEWGEATASAYLVKEKRMRQLASRWRYRHGELDLVMRDDHTMVFVEVRVRTSEPDPLATYHSIRRNKWKVLRSTSLAYLHQSAWRPHAIRFDVVGIRRQSNGQLLDIHHWERVRLFGPNLRF